MNPIELGKAIAEVGTPIITAVMLILVVGLVWYLIKRQTKREDKHDKIQEEERLYHRNIMTNHLEHISEVSLKNADLNVQGITLQKEMMKEMKSHDNYSREAWKNLNGSLAAICDRLNGNNFKKKVKKIDEKEK